MHRRYFGSVALVAAVMAATPAFAQSLEAEAERAVNAWLDAVRDGGAEALGAVLAPEFQIQRQNGVGLGRDAYIAGGAAQLAEFTARDLVATQYDDLLVVRYMLVATETIDGQPAEAEAPRLTVFRRDGERWLVVAHANFARIED